MKSIWISVPAMGALCGPAWAQQDQTPPAQATAMQAGDAALTCVQIADQAARLSQVMADDAEGGGLLGTVTDVARSGASMLVPGASLVMAGADAVTRPGREREEAAELTVQNRWYYLNGLAAGRDCGAEQQASVVSAPVAAPPATPTAVPAIVMPVGRLPAD